MLFSITNKYQQNDKNNTGESVARLSKYNINKNYYYYAISVWLILDGWLKSKLHRKHLNNQTFNSRDDSITFTELMKWLKYNAIAWFFSPEQASWLHAQLIIITTTPILNLSKGMWLKEAWNPQGYYEYCKKINKHSNKAHTNIGYHKNKMVYIQNKNWNDYENYLPTTNPNRNQSKLILQMRAEDNKQAVKNSLGNGKTNRENAKAINITERHYYRIKRDLIALNVSETPKDITAGQKDNESMTSYKENNNQEQPNLTTNETQINQIIEDERRLQIVKRNLDNEIIDFNTARDSRYWNLVAYDKLEQWSIKLDEKINRYQTLKRRITARKIKLQQTN